MKSEYVSDAPACYGKYPEDRAACAQCEFGRSCRYYTESAPKMESRLNMVSFEFVQNWSDLIADTVHVPGAEPVPENPAQDGKAAPEIPGMARFLRFMLELDDYTLGILSEIIVPRPDTAERCSVAELARVHRCTRQAIHRKMLRSARKNPEIAHLLELTFRKVRRSRSAFSRNTARRETLS
ncbi:MAG: hypothetical protein MJ016_00100 [Victivallaceae bacterium]|nr:hypothetical protein [Victivallaceae bacterium]